MASRIHRTIVASIAALGVMLTVSPAVVVADTPGPKTAATKKASQKEDLKATILVVRGNVMARIDGKKPVKVEKGMTFDHDVQLVTGPRSFVCFRLPPDQVYTLDRLSKLTILEASRNARTGLIKTDLGLKGRMHFEVHAGGIEHDVQVHTPGKTLAIRGTKGSISSSRGLDRAVSTVLYQGHVELTDRRNKKMIAFGEKH